MGLTSIFHPPDIDLVVISMPPHPLYEDDLPTIVDRNHQPVIVALDIEYDSIRSHNTCIGVALQDIGTGFPVRFFGFMKPGVQGSLDRLLIFAPLQRHYKFVEGFARNYSHKLSPRPQAQYYTCSQNGYKPASENRLPPLRTPSLAASLVGFLHFPRRGLESWFGLDEVFTAQPPGGRRKRPAALNRVRKLVPAGRLQIGGGLSRLPEVDLVDHCGARTEGSFLHTLVLTDVASGWTATAAWARP